MLCVEDTDGTEWRDIITLVVECLPNEGFEADVLSDWSKTNWISALTAKERSGEIIGTIIFSKFDNYSYIQCICTKQNARNRGIGHMLLSKLTRTTIHPIWMKTAADNTKARNLFIRSGFIETSRERLPIEIKKGSYSVFVFVPEQKKIWDLYQSHIELQERIKQVWKY